MKEMLIPDIIEKLTAYNRRMYDYGKNVRHYGTDQELRIDQIHVIDYIGRHPGCHLGAIATDTDSNLPTVSLQVKRLIKLGLVSKKRSEQDQREITLSLTDEGTAIFQYHKEMTANGFLPFQNFYQLLHMKNFLPLISFLKTLLDNKPNI